MIKNTQTILATVVAAAALNTTAHAQSSTTSPGSKPVKNVVLVHGAFADGSGWRGVYDELTQRGYLPMRWSDPDVRTPVRGRRKCFPSEDVGGPYGTAQINSPVTSTRGVTLSRSQSLDGDRAIPSTAGR